MEAYSAHPYTHGGAAVIPSIFPVTVLIGRAGTFATAGAVLDAATETAVVKTYTPAAGTATHPSYTVTVNGSPSHVYVHPASTIPLGCFTYFDFSSGPVTVTITTNVAITDAVVRPLNLGIVPSFVPGSQVATITLDPTTVPANMAFEVNGNLLNPLAIFAGAIETYPPSSDPTVQFVYREGVTYTRPASGTVNGITARGDLVIANGKTIVIEGGAIVKACVRMGVATASTVGGSTNCRVLGRGIVDAGGIPATTAADNNEYGPPMRCHKVTASEVNGVIFMGRGKWNFRVFGCTTVGTNDGASVRITNIKIINGQTPVAGTPPKEGTPDGMDIIACSNVTVDGAYVRTIDDGIVIKSSKNDKDGNWSGDLHNIVVKNSVIWQGPAGNPLSIGWEMGRRDVKGSTAINTTDRIHFINCDVIHKTAKDAWNHRAAMAIHNMDGYDLPLAAGHVPYSPITNVLFEDIRVEDCQQAYVNLYNAHSGCTGDTITFRNCSMMDGALPSVIRSVPGGLFTNVVFENFTIDGVPILSAAQGGFALTATSVTFTGQTGGDTFLVPVADAWVQNGGAAPQQEGTTARLIVKGTTSTPLQRKSYLRFDLSSFVPGSCASAILRLYCTSMDDGLIPVPVAVYEVTTGGDTFTEAITWGTSPTISTLITTTTITTDPGFYQWDVTAYVNTKLTTTDLVTFALYDETVANNKVQFASRQATNNKPQLLLTA